MLSVKMEPQQEKSVPQLGTTPKKDPSKVDSSQKSSDEAKLKAMFESAYKKLDTCTDYMAKEVSDTFRMLQTESNEENTRETSGDILAELGFGKLFVKMWNNMPSKNSLHQMQRLSMKRAYWNFTDLSKKFCLELGNAGALELLLQELENLKGSKSAQSQHHINTDLVILYNCARLCDTNRTLFREFCSKEKSNAVDILSCYLQDSDIVGKTDSLLTLAYIVEENESEKLATTGTDGCLSFLVSILEESLSYSNHRAQSVLFTTEEIIGGLNELAKNDANKVKIVQGGGVPLIAKVLANGLCEEEREIAARVFWRLAFVASNRQVICQNEDAIKALKEWQKSDITGIQEACTGALWELYEGQVNLNQVCDISSDGDQTLHKPHVMISYQWDVQERMIQLKDKLQTAGYNVWMDVDRMEGNILSTMAEAVEKAEVVLVGLSKRYKESTNCRTEASYAYKLKKPIVPLLAEVGYEPDGWLGALAGMLLYYRIYSEDVLTSDFSSLIKELGHKGMTVEDGDGRASGSSTDGQLHVMQSLGSKQSVDSIQKQNTTSQPPNIVSWSKEQVQSWLDDNDLREVNIQISSYCDGKHLYQMYRQFQRSPTFFESGLRSDLHFDFNTIIKFLTALEDLFSN